MKLYKLSFANVTKSFKNYAIYFFTLILGVSIFYVFNSLDSQTAMLEFSYRTGEVINLLKELISGVSVFISFVLGFLIIYASGFLIKKRGKEFGIYMLLGMSKRKISTMLLIETLIIGLLSLAVGLGIGIVVSQITSVFVAKLFDADMLSFKFNFSISATIKTVIYFGIIYFIVMIFNTIIINKQKLIDLLQSAKKSEKIKIKNPIVCIAIFIVSAIMLVIAYKMVSDPMSLMKDYSENIILVPIALGCVGTFLFFYSVSGLVLKIVTNFKNTYYRSLNCFTYKQISSKINTMVSSISVICIMLFLTICLLSAALSIKNQFNSTLDKYAPVDFELYESQNGTHYSEKEFIEIIENSDLYGEIKDVVYFKQYYDPNFLYDDSLGLYADEIKEMYPFINHNASVEIMSLTDYNNMANLFNLEKVDLSNNQYAIVANYDANIYDETLARGSKLTIFNEELIPYNTKTIDGFAIIQGNPANIGFFVVPDRLLQDNEDYLLFAIGNYKTSDRVKVLELDDKANEIVKNYQINLQTLTDVKASSVGLSAIATFIGLYLGLIFLISSAAILALKQLSDMIDDKEKYRVLRNIGVDEKDIRKAVFKQTFILFVLPLLLAIVHTIYGVKFSISILSSIGVSNMTTAIMVSALFIVMIYGGYFLTTYFSSLSIVNPEK